MMFQCHSLHNPFASCGVWHQPVSAECGRSDHKTHQAELVIATTTRQQQQELQASLYAEQHDDKKGCEFNV